MKINLANAGRESGTVVKGVSTTEYQTKKRVNMFIELELEELRLIESILEPIDTDAAMKIQMIAIAIILLMALMYIAWMLLIEEKSML